MPQPDAWNSATNAAIAFVRKVVAASLANESGMRATRSASAWPKMWSLGRKRETAGPTRVAVSMMSLARM